MSEQPYTPTTDEVRFSYADRRDFIAQISHGERKEDSVYDAEFDRWLDRVKANAVREHEEKRVVLHMDPTPPTIVPVTVPCPRCGWQR